MGFPASFSSGPQLHREIVPPRETVAIARVAIAIVGRGDEEAFRTRWQMKIK